MSDNTYQPTLSQLRAFVAVAEYRHFGTAASRLGVSQPTLSQALASLESGLGVQLIERSTRRVLVTEVGTALVERAKSTLTAADSFVAAAAGSGDNLHGPLRIGLIPTLAPYVLPKVLSALSMSLPGVVPFIVEDQTERLLASLRAGLLDIAMMALPSGGTGMTEIALQHEEFALVVPPGHPLAGRIDLTAQDLAGLPMLLLDEGHCLRDQALDVCRSSGTKPRGSDTRAASLTTVVQCVAGGLGVTLVPESALAVETARGVLGVARFAAPAPGRVLGVVHRGTSSRGADFAEVADVLRGAL